MSYSRLHNFILVLREPNSWKRCSDRFCYGVVPIGEEQVVACKVCEIWVCIRCELEVVEEDRHLHHCYKGDKPEVEVPETYKKCPACLGYSMRDINNPLLKCQMCKE